MNKMIPLSVPNLKGNEEKYVVDAIRSEWVSTGGSYIDRFEADIAEYLKVEGAVACQSGTAGLHLALTLSGVKEDDEVIVPTLTFIAAVNPVKYIGAYPIFMDCDENLILDVHKVREFFKTQCRYENGKLINLNTQRQIKAIVVVHVFGNLANMEEVMQLAEEYQLQVIEDATEALGTFYSEGKYKGRFAGTIGDYGVYSFNGNKIITTGGGGMLVARQLQQLQKAKYLSTQAKDDELYYLHNEVGYNYRMTNLQAAVGVAQLEQLEDFIKVKERNYKHYRELFKTVEGIELLPFNKRIRSNYWFYALKIDFDKVNLTKEKLIKRLGEEGIQTRPIWGLIHEQKPYLKEQSYEIKKATRYYEQIINIPCSSNLTVEEVEEVVKGIKGIISAE